MKLFNASIKDIVEKIDSNEILLPAIQRKYVWNEEQVLALFDSILRSYPFGTMIFWKIQDKTDINKYCFYKFIKDYKKDYLQNPKAGKIVKDSIFVVMDGQQRLTSLYMGIKGSRESLIRPGVRRSKEENWRTKYLYFIPCVALDERNEDDSDFKFVFLEKEKAEEENKTKNRENQNYLVSDFYGMTKAELREKLHVGQIRNDKQSWIYQLENLRQCLNDRKIIDYFEITNNKITDVLEIFKRINSGGETLSPANLIFSTIITNWEDGRDKIETLIEKLNKGGIIKLREDTIVRICLYVMNQPTDATTEALNHRTVEKIKKNWEKIEKAIIDTSKFLDKNNITDNVIRSYNAIFPIIYYYYYHNMAKNDMKEFVKYFVISQLFGIFGGSSSTTLSRVREKLCKQKDGVAQLGQVRKFYLKNLYDIDLSASRSNAFMITRDQVENVIDKNSYGTRNAYLIMCLLYQGVKVKKDEYDLDHVISKKEIKEKFLKYRRDTKYRIEIENLRDSVPNLQLLDVLDNRGEKQEDSLYEWVINKKNSIKYDPFKGEKDKYKIDDVDTLKEFCSKRRELILDAICDKLGIK